MGTHLFRIRCGPQGAGESPCDGHG